MQLTIPFPATFSFRRTAISHGWCELPPFALDRQAWTLTRVLDTGDAQPVTVHISDDAQTIYITTRRKLSKRAAERVLRDVRHMLRLDDDMTEFYQLIAGNPAFEWIARHGAGRMLRAPSVFEDLVKMMCTTNCSWSLTEKMVGSLVAALGREAADERRAFPTPEAMAAMPERFYRDTVRAGYRAAYLKELAERVASGEIDVESWLTSELPTDKLKREMKRVKGIGDYAAENLLKLVGRYDGLGLDSWVRPQFARKHNKGRAASDEKIRRHYARFGAWSGLALWCDLTEDWINEAGEAKW
ncbi:MAG: DNA-3-methyladenine glycosylase family protein [Blastocatellia bacterium]